MMEQKDIEIFSKRLQNLELMVGSMNRSSDNHVSIIEPDIVFFSIMLSFK